MYIPYLITNLGVFRKEFSTSSARKENGGGGVHPEVASGTFKTPKRRLIFCLLKIKTHKKCLIFECYNMF